MRDILWISNIQEMIENLKFQNFEIFKCLSKKINIKILSGEKYQIIRKP